MQAIYLKINYLWWLIGVFAQTVVMGKCKKEENQNIMINGKIGKYNLCQNNMSYNKI